MMFQRIYTVKGNDVNDFMVMQNAAYLHYASLIFDVFLLEKGFSKDKMNKQKVGLDKKKDQLFLNKHLMFTKEFTIKLEFLDLLFTNQKMNIAVHFYNEKQELCATVQRELFWFCYDSWQSVCPPKTISKYFSKTKEYRKVG